MGLIPFRNKLGSDLTDVRGAFGELRSELSRTVDGWLKEPRGWAERTFGFVGWPAVQLSERDDAFVVRAEIAGLDPAQLEITVSGNRLVLGGERKEVIDTRENNVQFSEMRYGKFRREILLPEAVDAERVSAESRHGIVTIELPKEVSRSSKKISVVDANEDRAN